MESPSHLERDRPTNERVRSGALDQWEAEAGAHTSVPPVDTGRAPASAALATPTRSVGSGRNLHRIKNHNKTFPDDKHYYGLS